MKLHSDQFQIQIKKEAQTSFNDFYDELKSEIDFEHPFLDNYFSTKLNTIIQNDDSLAEYSEKKFFWFSLVESLIHLLGLCEEYEEATTNQEEFEEEIFFFWDSSEHSKVFLDYLKEGKSVWETTHEMIPILENQIISYYHLHIDCSYDDKEKLVYNVIPEFGESDKFLYLSDKHLQASYDGKTFKTFPSLIIKSLNEKEIIFDKNSAKITSNKELFLEDFNIFVLPSCKQGAQSLNQIKQDIRKALTLIKEFAPNCYTAFKNFTRCVVPVNEKNIVSYSMQSLPGYSSINTFDRDFVDLMDDLIHENGHHVLNCILNSKDMIIEDDDKIYYSPWRRSLRPVRGIYHAVFTFSWAQELFSQLFENLSSLEDLNQDQKNKIAFRTIEEFEMLLYCEKDLEHAYANEKVTEEGQELIQEVLEDIKKHKKSAHSALEYLKENSEKLFTQIQELRKTLEKKNKEFR